MNDLFKPVSNWRPPEVLINYNESKALAVDTETYDPNLKKNGPGGFRSRYFSLR